MTISMNGKDHRSTEQQAKPLETRDLVVVYRHRGHQRLAIDQLSLDIEANEWIALLGPNGSGKSTLLKVASGQLAPQSGECLVLGDSVSSLDRRRIGVVFQTPALDPRLSIQENLIDLARLQGLDHSTAATRIRIELERLELLDRCDDRVSSLSGGLIRRVDIARAMIHEPDLLLLDEPTTGLDPVARKSCLSRLQTAHTEQGTTLIMSTHLVDEAERAQRVIMLHEGHCVADGTPRELCDAIGQRLIRISHPEFKPEDASGWEFHQGTWTRPVAADADPILESLLSKGIDLTVARPTLADVFERHSGSGLGELESVMP
ncbi:MAG: ABC transporter ATP-binding protein [Phycisphaerales bacterium]|nr:ABC transporter ATP-binding protein [Phycisphaerales bacterium]